MKGIIAVIITIAVSSLAMAQQADSLRVGAPAPDFSLPYATRDSIAGQPLSLHELLGQQNIIIAFYPADWSGGCTKEVCTLRDDFGNLQKLDAVILAISGDYVYSHHEWAKHHNLPFRLLSDHSHTVAKSYFSYNGKSGFNRRSVFVVDKRGNLAYIDYDYNVGNDADFNRLKDALAKLK